MKNTFEIHPFLFGIFPLISIFAVNIHIVKIQDLLSPITYVFLSIIVSTIIIKLILKNKEKTGFILTIGLLLFFSYGHFHEIIENEIDDFSHKILLSVFLILFFIGTLYFIKTKRKLNNAKKIINVIGIVIILISVMNIGIYFIQEESVVIDEFQNENTNKNILSEKIEFPNVYYIILDAYAGTESLERTFDFDNKEFYGFLENNNFYVPKHSHANYPHSYQSIGSALNMNYINEIDNLDLQKRTELVYKMSDTNNVMMNFKSKGYEIFNIYSGWGFTRDFSIADLNLCSDKIGIINSELFSMIVDKSILNPVFVRFFEDDRRELLQCHFTNIKNAHTITEKPMLLFAHITLPHSPYIFGPNGEEIIPKTLQLGEKYEIDKTGYLGQLQYTNKLLKDTIQEILLKNEIPPIIVLQGDHGSGEVPGWQNLDTEGLKERHSNFVAIYLPESDESIFYETITPVNIFRLILKNNFGDDYSLLEDKMYGQDPNPPWKFINVTKIVLED